MVVAASSSASSLHFDLFNSIQIQPTVLLSCADHHKRIQKKRLNYSKRVIGALLGKVDAENNVLLVSNAFAVPFDEDHSNKKKPALFVDNDYIETIYQMFLRVNTIVIQIEIALVSIVGYQNEHLQQREKGN
ncbi:MAG: 26S proteasome non-ATPase regulatory subunit 7 [Marteilia pararefringens]